MNGKMNVKLWSGPDTPAAPCEPATAPLGEESETMCARLLFACNGHPHALIPWPHRLLHEAVAHITAQAERLAELEEKHAVQVDRLMREKHERADSALDAECRARRAEARVGELEEALKASNECLTIAHMDGYHKGQKSCTEHTTSVRIGEAIIEAEAQKRMRIEAESALAAERERGMWKLIETAPHDGTHILAWDGREHFDHSPPTVVHWFEDGFYTSVNELAPERPYPAKVWTEPNESAALAATEVK